MKSSCHIIVRGTTDAVFAAFVNDELRVMNPATIAARRTSATTQKAGEQTILHVPHGQVTMEVKETLIEMSPPRRVASVVQIDRFLPPAPDTQDNSAPPRMQDEELRTAFRREFGRKPVTGLVLVEFKRLGGGTASERTAIRQSVDMQMGGLAGLLNLLLHRTPFSPVSRQLRAFKAAFESQNVPSAMADRAQASARRHDQGPDHP